MVNYATLYRITDLEGFTPHVSRLISMMNYARHTTLDSVKGLTVEQLDYLPTPQSNSIGMLLMHFAAVDYFYRVFTFEGREPDEEELERWGPALDLGDTGRAAIKGHDLDFYVKLLEETRAETLERFKTVDDEWLHREMPFWGNQPANHYFMWFHVFEDELNHRGQIRIMKKQL